MFKSWCNILYLALEVNLNMTDLFGKSESKRTNPLKERIAKVLGLNFGYSRK